MNPSLVLLSCIAGVAGLFWLDRDNSVRTSKALWLAVASMWISGSRPISIWLGMGTITGAGTTESPILQSGGLPDQLFAGILTTLGVIVIFNRGRHVTRMLKANWPTILYFSYCLLSVLWSDFTGLGFKRWLRAVGELVMIMVIVTDPQPIAALKHFFSRVGFVLLPSSVLLIKYYPALGRGFDEWGLQMNTGVTMNKNMLGVITYVITLGALWQVLKIVLDKKQPNRARHLLAQATLLSFGIWLLFNAHSATSGACFTLGAVFMLATSLPLFRRHPATLHTFVLVILLSGALVFLLGGGDEAAKAMGRNPDLTGRTAIWKVVTPMAPNSIVGAGFESFWAGPRLETVRLELHEFVQEAHDGYLEVYLNLGLIGVALIGLILAISYRNAVAAFRCDPLVGSLLIAYILTAAIYSITEAGFRMLDPIWFALLMAGPAANRVLSVRNRASRVETSPEYAPLLAFTSYK